MGRIVLALEHETNRELLSRRLEEQHDVHPLQGGDDFPQSFDLCIVDPPGLSARDSFLRGKRASEAPVFLPVLMVLGADGEVDSGTAVSEIVDEFIRVPTTVDRLEARIGTLLRTRMQSVRLKEQLLDAQRLESIAVLTGGVVHDFNNLLTPILTNAELALETLEPDHRVRKDLEDIRRAALKGSELTRRILSFCRSEAAGKEVVDVDDVASVSAKILEATVTDRFDFVRDLDGNLPPVRCDPVRLQQVIMNLVVNATEATPDQGTVILRTRASPDEDAPEMDSWVDVVVSDTGPGIDEETLDRIFDPFFTTKESGTGLGLASTLRIVEDMGGTIDVESEVGEGTSFRVRLPGSPDAEEDPEDAPPGSEEASEDQAEGASLRSDGEVSDGTVLVVDDEDAIRSVVSRILGEAGYGVLEAATAGDAFSMIRKSGGRVDVVLTDSILPGLARSELKEVLGRAAGEKISVAFMSGYEREEVVERLGHLGDAPFINKPFTPDELLEMIGRLMDGGGTGSE